jgi:hypothetical protein
MMEVRTGFFWLRTQTSGGLYEQANEPSVSVIYCKFLVQRSKFALLKKNSVPGVC